MANPQQIVESLSSTDARAARRLIGKDRAIEGLSREYYRHVADQFGRRGAEAIVLASHWKLILRYGDEPAFAYRARAAGEWLSGKFVAAAESFIRAGRHAEDPTDRRAFQIGAVDCLARVGKIEDAVRLGTRLARELSKLGAAIHAARVRLNLANALTRADRYREAVVQFKLAMPVLEANGLSQDMAACLLGISSSAVFLGDSALAASSALRARGVFEELDKAYFADLALINVAYADIAVGRADDALTRLLELRARLESSPGEERSFVEELLGDAYFELNLLEEARDCYRSAVERLGKGRTTPRLASCTFSLGQAEAALGSPVASMLVSRASRMFRRLGNEALVAECHLALAKILVANGDLMSGEKRARLAADGARKAGYKRLRARSLLELVGAKLIQGKTVGAELREVRSLIKRGSFISLEWRATYLLALSSTSSSRLKFYRQMFQQMLDARTLTRSTIARASFLSDKSAALRSYFEELLNRGRPQDLAEAVEVIRRSRSAALIDEILSADLPSQSFAIELEALRTELQRSSESDDNDSGVRRSSSSVAIEPGFRRDWIELSRRLLTSIDQLQPVHSVPACVLIETNSSYHAIEAGCHFDFGIGAGELSHLLSLIAFELVEPMLSPDASPAAALTLLNELRSRLSGPKLRDVVPDGQMWRVPWQALPYISGDEQETTVLVSPSFGQGARDTRINKDAKVAIWLNEQADLPFAAEEAEVVKNYFPSARICRTADEARDSLSESWDILHVAAHAIHLPDNPMFSYVGFSDGPLMAAEIVNSQSRVKCAILLACDSGRFSARFPQEPDGLVRAFLSRSARAVVGSCWPINDEAAYRIASEFYRVLAGGETVGEALSKARIEARSWQPHPYFWAAPALFGGYQASGEA